MNLDFLRDLVSLHPIKTTYVSNNLRVNLNFILDDHVKVRRANRAEVTLLEKLQRIFRMFLNNELDMNLMFDLFGCSLELNRAQFNYLHERFRNDVYVKELLTLMCNVVESHQNNVGDALKQSVIDAIDGENGFVNLSEFLLRECNNAVKIKVE
ncbi:hypothetical protein CaLGV096 [Clostera anastomosis granulovirus A]|uniref:Ac75-like protein n=1 Tax=Clostera anastomosis granulovirus A TaxID=1986289 RepID=U5KBV2_9BBAC|nr:hypothetical protein CaLGV096 [Clostera anastomosis granulovirus Henan]AGQ20354.1 hypothetical protein CaLGV096 [Clostera anastomosis granulovirus Henan]